MSSKPQLSIILSSITPELIINQHKFSRHYSYDCCVKGIYLVGMVWPQLTPPNFRGFFRFWISKHKFQSFWPKYFSVCYHSSCWTVVLNLPRVYHSICSCINNQSVSFLTFTANSPMWPRITKNQTGLDTTARFRTQNLVYQKYPKIKSPTICSSL